MKPAAPGSPTSPVSSPTPPGSPRSGGFAAGIGGAGQNSAAHFLIAAQVPGSTPFPTVIGANGTLTAAKATTNPVGETNPMAVVAAIDPTGSFLYQADWSGLTAFTIDRQTGDVTEMPDSPYENTQKFVGVTVDQLGKFIYGYAGPEVFAFSIEAGTGHLFPIAGSAFTVADSGQQFAVPSERMAVSQHDKFLFVGTASGIFAYSIDATTGALTMVQGSPFGAGAGQAFAIVAPSSGFLYEAIGNGAAPIHGYKIDSNTGALTEISGSPFGSSCSNTNNLTSPASGKFLFAANCGMYSIDASSGALTSLFADPLSPFRHLGGF
jgi:6-phosphogluconolactonase